MEFIQVLLLSVIGLFTGFLSGFFGIGSGSIRIPLLSFIGFPLINAFAINIFAIPFGSATGAIVHRKNIRFDIVNWFLFGGIIGIIISSFLVGFLSDKFLTIIFLFAALITVFGFYIEDISPKIYGLLSPNRVSLFSSAFFANLIVGLRGGSGGSLFPPILRSLHVRMHEAIATSLFVGITTAMFALIFYIFRGNLLIIPGLIVAITSVVGAYVGGKLSLVTRGFWLKIELAALEVLLAIILVVREFIF